MKSGCIEVSVYGEKNYRLFLDVIRQDLDVSGYTDLSATQALILLSMRENVVTIGELISRGYYVGSNASYNIKKLVKSGYVISEPSDYDKRTVFLRLTEKGLKLCDEIDELLSEHLSRAEAKTKNKIDMKLGIEVMKHIERIWLSILRGEMW